MIRKEYHSLVFLLLGSMALSFLNSPLFEIPFDDKEIFRYIGLVIYKGGSPYRDVFDHKPPLLYFLDSLWHVNVWIPWILDMLMVLSATILFYLLCKKNKLAFPWLLPFIFNLLLRYSLVAFGYGLTREYTTIFLLLFFCISQYNVKYRFFIMGVLIALTGWMQQEAMIIMLPLLCYTIFSSASGPGETGRRWIALIAGFMAISLPILAYFSAHRSLGCLWKDAFLINLHIPGEKISLTAKIKAIKHALHESEYEMAFYTSFILGFFSLFLKSRQPRLLYAAMMALLFSFAGEIITGRMEPGNAFIYYLLPLAATIPILVYVVFTGASVQSIQDKTAQLIFCLILSITLVLGTFRYAAAALGDQTGSQKIPEINYLKSQSLTDYQLYVFDDSNLISLYNQFKILAPSRWIYFFFWSWDPTWDQDNKIFFSIIRDLRQHRTRFILDCSHTRHNMSVKPVYTVWRKFLNDNYKLVMTDSLNRELWKTQ